jgi:hypothetical protein
MTIVAVPSRSCHLGVLLSRAAVPGLALPHLHEHERIKNMKKLASVVALLLAASAASAAPAYTVELKQLGSYESGKFAVGGAEIVSYDPLTRRAFVVNAAETTVDVLDIRNPANPVKVGNIDASALGGSANSVAVKLGIVAVAIEADVKTDPGIVAFYRSYDLKYLGQVTVGALPDMVTFTEDGRYVLVANEGEPNDAYTVDPDGSVSIIDLRRGVSRATVKHATFTSFNSQIDDLRAKGVRIYGPQADLTVAQNLEPEYITVEGNRAYVTLQEANAIATIDIAQAKVLKIQPLGFKDHMLPENKLDASDRDGVNSDELTDDDGNKEGKIALENWPVFGMYQPDSIGSYTHGGKTYLVTANEGDTRSVDGFDEEIRVRANSGSPNSLIDQAFPNISTLRDNARLGRLTITKATGDTNNDGKLDKLYVPGARSFSIWDAVTGEQVFDSGSDFESIVGNLFPAGFNANHEINNDAADPDDRSFDTRSDNKGPEPEGLALGTYFGRTYAFVGLERAGGIMVYDISNPVDPEFVQYVNNRNLSVPACTGPINLETELCFDSNPAAGDLGPEGLHFVPWYLSPTFRPLLIVGNEVSGSTTVYQLNLKAL